MATNSNDSIQIRYSDPIYLYVCSGVDNSGNSNFGGYAIYVVKVPMFETPDLSSSGLLYTRKLEHVKNIYPEIDVSYDTRINRIGGNPIRRMVYTPNYIYPVEYYVSEENWDHYFYLAAFDKDNNMSSGFVSHPKNPFRGPSVVARAIQFAHSGSFAVLYTSGYLYRAGSYPSGTVSFWLNTTSDNYPLFDNTDIVNIISKHRTDSRCPAPITIQAYKNLTTKLRAVLGTAATTAYNVGDEFTVYSVDIDFTINKKYHCVFVWSGVTSTTYSGTWYIDGVKVSGETLTISFGVPQGYDNIHTYLGAEGGATRSISGLIIDGIYYYNIPFSESQVFTLYSGQVHGIRGNYLDSSLLTKFSFDEGSGIITYANYPVISPIISGVMVGDIRWVRPLYTELRPENVNTQVLQFFNTYVNISGALNSGVVTPGNVSFQDRIFTNSGVRGEVEGLNNNGVIASNKVPDTALQNQKILYIEDANTIKQVGGITQKLKYTTLQGVQEYRHIWSSTSVTTTPSNLGIAPTVGTELEFISQVSGLGSGVVAFIPFNMTSGIDTMIRVSAQAYSTTTNKWISMVGQVGDSTTSYSPITFWSYSGTVYTLPGVSGIGSITSTKTGRAYLRLDLNNSENNPLYKAYCKNITVEVSNH